MSSVMQKWNGFSPAPLKPVTSLLADAPRLVAFGVRMGLLRFPVAASPRAGLRDSEVQTEAHGYNTHDAQCDKIVLFGEHLKQR